MRSIPTKRRIGVWIRVSTEDQARGESPEHHEARARAYAVAKDWEVVEVYRLAGVSGKAVSEHSEARRMVADVERGHIDGLVFSKLARLARNTRELLDFADKFRQCGADLISLQESIDTSTPAGRLFYTVIAAMAEWERAEISARVAASVPIRAQLGKPLGGAAPFGYQWIDRKMVPDPQEAPIRRLMYELFLEHRRRRTVARKLNEMGHRTRNGGEFSDTTVLRLLRDPSAKGVRLANHTKSRGQGKGWDEKPASEWITIPIEPIVGEALWDQCNAILDGMREANSGKRKGRKPQHLFAGLVFCHCGKKMYVLSNSPKYTCQTCRNKIPATDLEAIFEEKIKGFFYSTDEIEQYLATADAHGKKQEERLALIRKELQNIDQRIDKLIDLFGTESLTREGFDSRYQPLEGQKQELLAEEARIAAQLDLMRIDAMSVEHISGEGHDLFDRWQTLDYEEKRPIVESFCSEIIIGDKEVRISLVYFPSLKDVAKSQHNVTSSSRQRARTGWQTYKCRLRD